MGAITTCMVHWETDDRDIASPFSTGGGITPKNKKAEGRKKSTAHGQ